MPLPTRPAICALLASAAAFGASPALAQQTAKTAAGTTINNTATASYDDPGGNDPVLAQDGSASVFVLADIPKDATNGEFGLAGLAAIASGSGSLAGLRITDDVPTGASYRPAGVTLNDAAKTDAVDTDEARSPTARSPRRSARCRRARPGP